MEMKKFKITIQKFFEEEIVASTEAKAIDIAWTIWAQDAEVEINVEEVSE